MTGNQLRYFEIVQALLPSQCLDETINVGKNRCACSLKTSVPAFYSVMRTMSIVDRTLINIPQVDRELCWPSTAAPWPPNVRIFEVNLVSDHHSFWRKIIVLNQFLECFNNILPREKCQWGEMQTPNHSLSSSRHNTFSHL